MGLTHEINVGQQSRSNKESSPIMKDDDSFRHDSISSLDWSICTKEPLTPLEKNDDKSPQPKLVSFASMAKVCFIPHLDASVDYDSLYYNDEELADFRHEAFLEELGLADEF